MSDDRLAALQRIAYGPGATDAERAAAEVELATLRAAAAPPAPTLPPATPPESAAPESTTDGPAAEDEPEAFVPLSAPPVARAPVALAALLALGAVLALGGATVAALSPAPPSLAVFDRDMTEAEEALLSSLLQGSEPPEDFALRILQPLDEERVLVAATSRFQEDASVCFGSVDAVTASAATAATVVVCDTVAAFVEHGLGGGTSQESYFWGPTGGPRVYDLPLAEVIERGWETVQTDGPR